MTKTSGKMSKPEKQSSKKNRKNQREFEHTPSISNDLQEMFIGFIEAGNCIKRKCVNFKESISGTLFMFFELNHIPHSLAKATTLFTQ